MLAFLRTLFAPPENPAARDTYIALVERARNPFFYDSLSVPDTLDGRFELILLHLFLLQQRLMQTSTDQKASRASEPSASEAARQVDQPINPEQTKEFSRQLSVLFFADMDRSLRQMGVADTGVRYRIKAMAKAYHGRLQAYTAAQDSEQLCTALARNLYGTLQEGDVTTLAHAAEYVQTMQQSLAHTATDALLAGHFQWPMMLQAQAA